MINARREHWLSLLFLLSVFVLSLLKIDDTDAWMHLSVGRLIWETKGLPVREVFAYPALDLPFLYTSWLFALIYYLSYFAFNIYGVILLKALTITTAFSILLRDSLRPYRNHFISILTLSVMVIMARYRFVERPDTFMMVFLSFSIFSLNAYIHDNKKYIYWLPFIHMLWANCHSSVVLMFIPFFAFLAGGGLQRILEKRGFSFPATPSVAQLRTLLLIFIGSFGATLINPNFLGEYYYGSSILTTAVYTQAIPELQPTTWQLSAWPYLVACAIVISFALNRKRFSLMHLLLVLPFIVFALTIRRFIVLEAIIGGPILARNLSSYVESRTGKAFFFGKPAALLLTAWLMIYSAGVYTSTFTLHDIKQFYGFSVDTSFIPEKALVYMDRNQIDGKIFNLFEWGGYITWRDFPKRSVFIDPRGYIPQEILGKYFSAFNAPKELAALDAQYGFDSIITNYNFEMSPFDGGLSEAFDSKKWALVYWDDISILFLKKTGRYEALARRDEYRHSLLGINLARLNQPVYSNEVIGELQRNVRETGSAKAYDLLGSVYNETGQFPRAVEAFKAALKNSLDESVAACKGMAYALGNMGALEESITYYKRALALQEDASTLYNIGIMYVRAENDKKAVPFLEKAIELNPALTSAYPFLATVYRSLAWENKINDLTMRYNNAVATLKAEEHFKNGSEAYGKRLYADALMEFDKSLEVSPSNPVSCNNIGFIYYDVNDLEKAFEYHKKALDIDPRFANAHHGLALIFKKWGNMAAAKAEWREYLNLEPKGYFAKKAAEEMSRMGSL